MNLIANKKEDSSGAHIMDLTSTLLKVDLAVLSVVVGIIVVFYKWFGEVRAEMIRAAKQQTVLEETDKFHGQRLDSLESWRAAISEVRRSQ
ncbi:hypothetical protein [Microcoleus sp. CAWBG58]|uniref:hypothetical protein n=1 Tax=Microcoleus sp. CAWBG58 TaxID=2841651 RepID=UPI0025E82C1E|nr:hypothetical protein [Microcoleus sp. CAWBG58]